MINLVKQGSSLIITSDQLFPFESGKIIVPLNSITYKLEEETDIVCFKSVANNDILFTGRIQDIKINGTQATKDNIIELFDSVANGASGGVDPEHCVTSINGQVGDVTITANDLDAYTKNEINAKGYLTKVVLTQSEYDAIPEAELDPNILYVISDAPEAQEKLVSGTNIKTINNESILGSGNIEIAVNIVEITQQAYDDLTDKDPDTLYVITDASPIATQAWTTEQINNAISGVNTKIADITNKIGG